jgi:hypothetical protein
MSPAGQKNFVVRLQYTARNGAFLVPDFRPVGQSVIDWAARSVPYASSMFPARDHHGFAANGWSPTGASGTATSNILAPWALKGN